MDGRDEDKTLEYMEQEGGDIIQGLGSVRTENSDGKSYYSVIMFFDFKFSCLAAGSLIVLPRYLLNRM